jgi:lipoate-protein ligase A
MSDPWVVEHRRGSASDLHGDDMPDPVARAVWYLDVTGPAIVLGSTQSDELVDPARAASEGVEVAHRRSGGGAVWLSPATATWIDVLLPVDDPRWDQDVSRSAMWLGEAWVDALASLGLPGGEVHRGGMERRPWSDAVCFAGLGPGEVTVGGRKVVGISQRRTRAGARFQCAVLHHWDPVPLLEVLRLEPGERALAVTELAAVAIGLDDLDVPVVASQVLAALTAALG